VLLRPAPPSAPAAAHSTQQGGQQQTAADSRGQQRSLGGCTLGHGCAHRCWQPPAGPAAEALDASPL
jgi:hypothetical protein